MNRDNPKKRKCIPFRWLRNWIWDIQFWWEEEKRHDKMEEEISQVEGYSGHGSMDGFRIYKQYMQEYEERKQQHNLRKLQS